MTESIEIRNYSNEEGFPGCNANAGSFVYERITFDRKKYGDFHVFSPLRRFLNKTKINTVSFFIRFSLAGTYCE